MEKTLADNLVKEAVKQLAIRPGFRSVPINEERFLELLGRMQVPADPKEPFMRFGEKYIFDFLRKGECEHYRIDAQAQAEAKRHLYLRALVLNAKVEPDANAGAHLSLFERAEMKLIKENIKHYHKGFSSPAEYHLLIAANPEMADFAAELARRKNPYSLLLCVNDSIAENAEAVHQERYPIWICPGATEEEITQKILPAEVKRREGRIEFPLQKGSAAFKNG